MSPMHDMIENELLRLRPLLLGDDAVLDFPVLAELQAQGFTDHSALIFRFSPIAWVFTRQDGMACSFARDHPAGFVDANPNAIATVMEAVAVTLKDWMRETVSRNVAMTYLGARAGGKRRSRPATGGTQRRLALPLVPRPLPPASPCMWAGWCSAIWGSLTAGGEIVR